MSSFLKFMNKMTNESVLSYYNIQQKKYFILYFSKYWRNVNIIIRSLCAGDFRYLICYSFISAHVIHRKWHNKIKKPNQHNFYRSKQYNSIIGKYYIHKRVFSRLKNLMQSPENFDVITNRQHYSSLSNSVEDYLTFSLSE